MSETFRTAWLSDIVDIIDKPETNRIICHGKEFVLVKHGHWVKETIESKYGKSQSMWHCSECDNLELNNSPYCPCCGARMDEIQEEWEEPEINPCRGCDDYDGRGGCKSNGGCGRGDL